MTLWPKARPVLGSGVVGLRQVHAPAQGAPVPWESRGHLGSLCEEAIAPQFRVSGT